MSTFKGFSSVRLSAPKRSKFDLSHEKRLSTRMGRLTPIFISETMPNDTFRCNSEVLLRMAPMLAPIMHRVNVFVHYFFIPNRLLWADWEKFITNGRLGTETPPVPPNMKFTSVATPALELFSESKLWDYLGGTPIVDSALAAYGNATFDLLPFAAYYKVWYDYYRDRNFVADNTILPLSSGTFAGSADLLLGLQNRHWSAGYFETALPWTQRGNEVLMPLSGSGQVTYKLPSLVRKDVGDVLVDAANVRTDSAGRIQGGVAGDLSYIDNIESVDISTSDVSINDLRRSIRLQEWLERNALAGSRYSESILAHFGRHSSDSRLQRAEYLGGGKVVVKIDSIVTTAYSQDADANVVPPANMAGHGVSFGNMNQFTYNCEEHGFIIGIMSVMPTPAYMQGIPRMFRQRNTFLDYPWPSFAHLGEQEVYTSEIFGSSGNVPVDRTASPVFGYQSRYSDWKYIPNSTHGSFRTTLDFWHLTRKFSSSPVLGNTFLQFEDALQDRIFAVSGTDTLWCYIYNQCSVIRSLPYFGTPML